MQVTISSIIKKYWYMFLPSYVILLSFNFIDNIIVQLISYSLTIAFMFILLRRKFPVMFQNKQRPSFKDVIEIIMLSWLARILTGLLVVVINIFFPVDVSDSPSQYSLWEQFYLAVFVAPVVEETYFRGIALHCLLPFGISFAFIVNSLFFSLPHLDLTYIVNAFLGGLVFSYAAYKYGIKWSILLHALSNAFSVILSYISINDKVIFTVKNQIITANTLTGFTLLLVTVLCLMYYVVKGTKNRTIIKEFWIQYRPNPNQLFEIFKNPWSIMYIIINIIQLNTA
ncbi:MAG: CPBP family intramembrane metalloprotease [Negativicutes bacterium]|nr:CPBP family intramembrane metalloprotease [Negativicutes bacterium]